MAEALLLKSGTGFDDTELSAKPENVRIGKKFLGNGNDDVQTGSVPVIAKITKGMGINESYNIPAGIHGGEDTFSQSGIVVEDGPIVDPTAGGQTLPVAGHVLITDTVIRNIENLRPEVIKSGIHIADILGSYEGFPDEEG